MMRSVTDTKTRFQGVYARHRKTCTKPKSDGRCCGAGFYATVYDATIKRNVKGPTKATAGEANRWRSRTRQSLEAGVAIRDPDVLTLEDACRRFIEAARAGVALNKRNQPYKRSAVEDYAGCFDAHVLKRFPRHRLTRLSRADVQGMVDDLAQQGLSGSRIRSVVTALRALYRWAIDRDLAASDPAKQIRLPAMGEQERPNIPEPKHLAACLEVLPLCDRIPFALAGYGTGRAAEIRHLTWGNVELGQTVRVTFGENAEKARKTRKAHRTIVAPKPLASLLRQWHMAQGRPVDGPVCPGRTGALLSTYTLYEQCDDVWGKQDPPLQPFRLHDARHTAASMLIASGAGPKVVSDLMGHSSVGITFDRYGHLFPGDEEAAALALDRFLERESG
jgi:integrase